MKCVMNNQTTEIKRVDDNMAERLVKSGVWQFVPKSMWKKATRKDAE